MGAKGDTIKEAQQARLQNLRNCLGNQSFGGQRCAP
jgi:hypothetical protein